MRTLAWFSLLVGLVWLAGCGDSGVTPPTSTDPDPPDTEHPDPVPDPDSEVLCEALGYHCSIADVDDEVLERGDLLLVELKDRIESGTSPALAAAWLEEQDGIRQVGVLDSGITFLLHGGIPMFLMTPETDGAGAPPRAIPPPSRSVVGHDTPRDNEEKRKKALVLSPFLFEEATGDRGEEVAALLASSRDYRPGSDGSPRVRWIANPEQPDVGNGRPTVEDFLGWHVYDFVLLHTHGLEWMDHPRWCLQFDPYFCVSAILTGRRVKDCQQAKELYEAYDGVTCGGTLNAEGSFVVLTTDFFDQEYGSFFGSSGLDKAIVIFSACHSTANGSLAAKLGGSRSEFFGWSTTANGSEASAAVIRLVQLMVTDGRISSEAYATLAAEGRHRAGGATLQRHGNGRGLYIREITTMKNPMAGGGSPAPLRTPGPGLAPGDVEMTAGDVLPFVGQAGDGEPDELFFFVDVDGVEAGKESDFSLGIELDNEELGSWSLEGEHARRIDETTVRIRVHQPVDFDVQPGQTATLKAITTLPDDGESPHELQVAFQNPILHVRSKIRSSAEGIEIASDVEGEVDLSFKRGENPDELEVAESIGDLRYLSFQVEMPAAAGCTFTTQTVSGRLGIPEADIDFKDPESGDFGVPEDLVLVVYPETRETVTIECLEGSTSLDMIHWFAGFVVFHGGLLGGPNELDEARGGFVIENWQPGDEGVYARRVYQRTGVEDEVTLEEDTTLELRGPGYGGGATGPPSARMTAHR